MDTDPKYTYALALLVLIGVAIVLRALCFRKQATPSSNPEVNQARHDITQARDLLNQLSLQLLSEDKLSATSPQSTATGATIDPTVLADIFNARLSIFEAQMMTAFTEMEQIGLLCSSNKRPRPYNRWRSLGSGFPLKESEVFPKMPPNICGK